MILLMKMNASESSNLSNYNYFAGGTCPSFAPLMGAHDSILLE